MRSPELIHLTPVGTLDGGVLEAIRPAVSERFGVPARIAAAIPLRDEWVDARRAQLQADPILDALVVRETPHHWNLGVVDHDLFVPGINFIFGQATVGGCCAVIGLARLRPEFYGQNPDPALFLERVLTEAVHELGHIAGLDHCPDPRCVMHFSTDIEDSDHKGTHFCDRCRGNT